MSAIKFEQCLQIDKYAIKIYIKTVRKETTLHLKTVDIKLVLDIKLRPIFWIS